MKTLQLSVSCLVMRIRFIIDPSARKRDLEEVTESYNLPQEGLKYLKWRNEYTVSNFFYTWNMVKDFFITNLQVNILIVEDYPTMLMISPRISTKQLDCTTQLQTLPSTTPRRETSGVSSVWPPPAFLWVTHFTGSSLYNLLLVINFGSCT